MLASKKLFSRCPTLTTWHGLEESDFIEMKGSIRFAALLSPTAYERYSQK